MISNKRHPLGNTRACGAAYKLEGMDVIQRDLDRLETCGYTNLMELKKTKCNVLHMGRADPHYPYSLQDQQIESRPAEKDLEIYW